jgi:diadenosine tetraphosphatase ApaH/serine/threonine PP2A family protein phosphatase
VRNLILSDIHANHEALLAVLKHARGRYDRILCLGDLVGYGAEPNEVVEWAREILGRADGDAKIIRGNHDKACCGLDSIEDFNPAAQASSIWTGETLTEGNLEFLRQLVQGPLDAGGFDLVHGAPSDEDEYIISTTDAAGMREHLRTGLTFFGHTHLQGGFFFRRAAVKVIDRVPRKWTELTISIDEQSSFLINPGSVGQPRDGDWRAAYAIYESDDRLVSYYRVEYDAETARGRIRDAGLPAILGDRLLVGK